MVLTLVLVGLAGLGASRRAPRRVDDRGDGVLIANLTMAFAVVVVAISAVLLAFSLLQRGQAKDRPASATRGGAKVIASMMVVFALMMLILRRLKRDESANPLAPVADAPPAPASQPAGSGRPTWGLWLGLAMVTVAVIAAIVLAVMARRRRSAGNRILRDPHADAAAAVGDVVRDVEDEPDPRRAVIRAYDGMERVFASFGTVRRESETPAEFLERAVTRTGLSPGSMRGLTTLYVSARFDSRDIDEPMRRRSIDALRAVRDELEGIAALPLDTPGPVGSRR